VIRELFPPDVVTVTHRPGDWEGALLPSERPTVARAVPKRVREFTAGRMCARRALGELGIEDFAIEVGPQRSPVWPEGVCGSISHTDDWCGAVVTRIGAIVSLGLDVEPARPLDDDLTDLVCGPEELVLARRTEWAVDPRKLLFSAKESVFKANYPLAPEMLEFRAVAVELDAATGTFVARRVDGGPQLAGGRELRGRFAFDADNVFTSVCVLA